MQETHEKQVRPLGQEDPLEKEMATHSNLLAWEIPQTEEPVRLQSMGLQSQTQLSDWAPTEKEMDWQYIYCCFTLEATLDMLFF